MTIERLKEEIADMERSSERMMRNMDMYTQKFEKATAERKERDCLMAKSIEVISDLRDRLDEKASTTDALGKKLDELRDWEGRRVLMVDIVQKLVKDPTHKDAWHSFIYTRGTPGLCGYDPSGHGEDILREYLELAASGAPSAVWRYLENRH